MTDRWQFVRDIDPYLYPKHAPFPGAWLAPLRLPGLKCFWVANIRYHHDINIYRYPSLNSQPRFGRTSTATVNMDINSTWPGAIAPYVNDTAWAGRMGLDFVGSAITGNLTVGLWVYFSDLSAISALIARWRTPLGAGARSFWLYYDVTAGKIKFATCSDGTAGDVITATDDTTIATGQWYFAVGRFDAGTATEVYVDGTLTSNTAAPHATLFDDGGSEWMHIGRVHATYNLNGRIAQAWYCTYVVPDHVLDWLWKVQRPLFGRA